MDPLQSLSLLYRGQPVSCRVQGWALDFPMGSSLAGTLALQQPALQPPRDTECVERRTLVLVLMSPVITKLRCCLMLTSAMPAQEGLCFP